MLLAVDVLSASLAEAVLRPPTALTVGVLAGGEVVVVVADPVELAVLPVVPVALAALVVPVELALLGVADRRPLVELPLELAALVVPVELVIADRCRRLLHP